MNWNDFLEYKKILLKGEQNELIAFFEEKRELFLPASILVDKARSIQISESNAFNLKKKKKILLEAISIDELCISAYLELGCFYYAVLGDNDKSKDIFQKGIQRLNHLQKEILMEYQKVLTDDSL